MSKSWLPALKDSKGNKFIGMMGQFDDRNDAYTKLLGDGLFYIPFGLLVDGLVEYDSEIGLLNAKVHVSAGPLSGEYAVIAGPLFDEACRVGDPVTETGEQ